MFDRLGRTFIVAEIGVNHEGDEATAHELIRRAAAAGVDAVKFQTYVPEQYISVVQPERLRTVSGRALPYTAFKRLADTAAECCVTFFSTPLGLGDVDFLNTLQPIFKVASGELTWGDLLHRIAVTGKPIIVSTGLALENEIRAALDVIFAARPSARTDGSVMLMHCVSAYPTPASEANLRNLRWLADTFGLPTGYSDHTLGRKACELAVAVGAVAIEKHFTYRKENQTFRDHELSLDTADMAELVRKIREVELYLGTYKRVRGAAESENFKLARRSLAAAIDIPAGVAVKREWLTALRPLWGIPIEDKDSIVGRRLNRAVPKGDLIAPGDVAD